MGRGQFARGPGHETRHVGIAYVNISPGSGGGVEGDHYYFRL